LTRARDHFDKVEEELLQRAAATGGRLTPAENEFIRQSALSAAECDFFLPDYEEAIRRYKQIALRYPGRVEELAALSFQWQCYYRKDEPAKAREVAVKVREVLSQVKDEMFDGSTEHHHRAFWENWLKQANAALEKPKSGG